MVTKRQINQLVTRSVRSRNPGNAEPRARRRAGTPTLIFTIMGPPVGKQRARSAVHSARHVTPKKTREYEKHVGVTARMAVLRLLPELQQAFPTYEQVYLDLEIYHENGRKPDSDNVVKAIEDGCTGILWDDDRHVLPRVQRESWPDDRPRVEVRIAPTEDHPGNGVALCEFEYAD